jgi:hypothetical protein
MLGLENTAEVECDSLAVAFLFFGVIPFRGALISLHDVGF